MREGKFPEASKTVSIDTLIVGGGISGLSAARYFKKNNYNDFLLIELDNKLGGNSKGSQNSISEFPLGAHYLPIPSNSFKDLIDFLYQQNIITGFDPNGAPIYNEYYLCFEPQERLFYRGVWAEGLPSKEQLNDLDAKELDRFMSAIESFKNKIGSDGKPSFCIPLELSSQDPEFLALDDTTIQEYLTKEKYSGDFIYWYLNYCCKDDFGTSIKNVSAWAGLHYFAARNVKSNSHSGDVLTWPEGNYFLVKCLEKECKDKILSNSLAYKITKDGSLYNCHIFDVSKNESIIYKCKNLVLATPQYVNKRLLGNSITVNWDEFNYYPWMVANISISDKEFLNGTNGILSWDNVMYNSNSLGYVNACHQSLNTMSKSTILTYYFNFSEKDSKEERKNIYEKDENYWRAFIIDDLKIAHPNIEEYIESIEIQVWGHGMIAPEKGFKNSLLRKTLSEGVDNIHFINSDVSGISIFEQAFYRGTEAAKKIIQIQNG